ncbi:MAG: hypothetical protein BAJALOKI1v1_1080003 [Promethearchaeota archaeon]|nr:MAG: hypothetical protein BAJALOKI1v1_1080003 [Candidatus Lokiarchaeota archaeon]
MELPKYSIGTGDRFGQQGKALLNAVMKAAQEQVDLTIVWNKSEREHEIIGTEPKDVYIEVQNAVEELNYQGKYFIDADHIGLSNVDKFIEYSNYFTLDVADFIGKSAPKKELDLFIELCEQYIGEIKIPHINTPLFADSEKIHEIARKYLVAVKEAGKIYRYIEKRKGKENFITEVSMDETDNPQNPLEIFFILYAISEENIPIQTIAPKFTGSFFKGIDYIGDLTQFSTEFKNDLAIIQFAIKEFGLPQNLKLSIHSGSDKFSLYEIINQSIKKFSTGVHIKTAGTTWLEELKGLALAGNESLKIVKEIYKKAYKRYEELATPYSSVINIEKGALPPPAMVNSWSGKKVANRLNHEPKNEVFDKNFRQMLHIAYKIAAEMGKRFINALNSHQDLISEHVTYNIHEKHIKKIFY